jgi:hypothetical protein
MKPTTLVAAVAALAAGAAQAGDTELIIFKQPNFRGQSYVVDGEVANLEGGFAREGSSLVVKGGYWEVCNRDHFKGKCQVLESGSYPRLRSSLDERIVSVRFLGTDQKLAKRVDREERREARREAREERRGDRWERRDRVARGGSIDLYGRPNFRGRSVRVEDSAPDLWEKQFDGRASSAIVREGTWQLCTQPGYSGSCLVVGPGEYPRLATLNDRVSSIRQVH